MLLRLGTAAVMLAATRAAVGVQGAFRAVRLDGGKKPATEQLLFAFGDNQTSKGTFVLDAEGAALVMAKWRDQGNDLPIDYEHEIAIAAEDPEFKGGALKTAGYFKLELREDGIYAVSIDWTPEALQKLADGELKYTSPWFFTDDSNRIVGIGNFSLVARPATKNQRPIAASIVDHRTVALSAALTFDQVRDALWRALRAAFPDIGIYPCDVYDDAVIVDVGGSLFRIPYQLDGAEAVLDLEAKSPVIRTYTPTPAPAAAAATEEDPPMKNLLATLSLPVTLTEAEAVVQASAQVTAQRQAESELLALTGAKNRSEMLGVITAWKAGGEQVQRLTAELTKRDGEARERDVAQLLAQGEADGKVTPAERPVLLAQGLKDPDFLRSYIAAAPKKLPPESKPPAGAGPTAVMLTDEDKKVAKMMGVSEEKLAATKGKLSGVTGS